MNEQDENKLRKVLANCEMPDENEDFFDFLVELMHDWQNRDKL